MAQPSSGRPGRWREGRRNDQVVVDAARDVLRADPYASMARIAEAAGVGVGSLYRRYTGRDELVQRVCADGIARIEALARDATDRLDDDPWAVFERFVLDALDDGAGSLRRLAGTFAPTTALHDAARSRHATITALLERAQAAHVVRPDVSGADLELLWEQAQSLRISGPDRDHELRRRLLTLALHGLRHPAAGPLPHAPASWHDGEPRWRAGTPDEGEAR